jgi:hypothetical protein
LFSAAPSTGRRFSLSAVHESWPLATGAAQLISLGSYRTHGIARVAILHTREHPFASGRNVDQDAIADPREGEAVWLVHPAPYSARVTVNFSGERVEIEIIV